MKQILKKILNRLLLFFSLICYLDVCFAPVNLKVVTQDYLLQKTLVTEIQAFYSNIKNFKIP